jgi:hypothetical protein
MKLSRSNFWGVTSLGCVLLLDIAVHLFRRPAGFEAWDYFEWGMNAALVLLIWFGYRRQLRDLDSIAETLNEKALSRVSRASGATVLLSYLFLLQALSHMHRH